jgi:hypothetical protein
MVRFRLKMADGLITVPKALDLQPMLIQTATAIADAVLVGVIILEGLFLGHMFRSAEVRKRKA